jgi:hypothetical protein
MTRKCPKKSVKKIQVVLQEPFSLVWQAIADQYPGESQAAVLKNILRQRPEYATINTNAKPV